MTGFRWKLFTFAWRLNFTGRMIERTRCTIRTGWNYAGDTMQRMPAWTDAHPRNVADFQIKTDMQTMKQVNTIEEIDKWIETANHGEYVIYGSFSDGLRRMSANIMKAARVHEGFGRVQLFQKRAPDASINYLMRRTTNDESHSKR